MLCVSLLSTVNSHFRRWQLYPVAFFVDLQRVNTPHNDGKTIISSDGTPHRSAHEYTAGLGMDSGLRHGRLHVYAYGVGCGRGAVHYRECAHGGPKCITHAV